MKRGLILFLGAALVMMMASDVLVQGQKAPEPAPAPAQPLVERRVKDLGPLPIPAAPPLSTGGISISPNGERMGYTLIDRTRVIKQGKGLTPRYESCCVCDGRPGPFYYYAGGGPSFSPDSDAFYYLVRRRRGDVIKDSLVRNGIIGPEYHYILGALFSPDSKHFAYRVDYPSSTEAELNRSNMVLLDGMQVFAGSETEELVFSPDSQHLAFIATPVFRGKVCVILDGEIGPSYDGVLSEAPVFSPDSKQIAYWALHKGKRFVAVAELREGKWVVVHDWKDAPTHDGRMQLPVFSPDSQHMAYVGVDGGKASVWLDGKQQEASYQGIAPPLFSPDSKRLAYVAIQGEEKFVVCDGKEGTHYDLVQYPFCVFSPDSKHLAYIGWRGAKGDPAKWRGARWFLVCDGMEGPPVAYTMREGPDEKAPVFSPDSKHLAYFCERGREQFIMCDGIAGPAHAIVRIPEKYCLVDGKAITPGMDPAPPDKNGTLRYVVGDGKEAWLVEVDWPAGLDWRNGMMEIDKEKK